MGAGIGRHGADAAGLRVSLLPVCRMLSAAQLLLWCTIGTALAAILLAGLETLGPQLFSPIFGLLLRSYDPHGNLLLLALAACAFALRRNSGPLAIVAFAGAHPWRVAAGALPLLCLGALYAYRNYPLSMDESVALFQARAFAAGALSGRFPPQLLDDLIPKFFQGFFYIVGRPGGEVAGSYWPGFALLLAPFELLGVPWMANPVLGALTLPVVHRLALAVGGSREAAGWALLLTAASPVFVVAAISYYAMAAHLLCNALYALLLLRPTLARVVLAGLLGSFALVLHNPVPHLFFATAFVVWLAARGNFGLLAALLAAYLPLGVLLGFGWQHFLGTLPSVAAAAAGSGAEQAVATGTSLLGKAWGMITGLFTLPDGRTLAGRLAGLTKIWTWSAAALVVLAAAGCAQLRTNIGARLLAAAFAITFFGYFLVRFDQGHGWGYRYIHAAWFALPVLAALALTREPPKAGDEVRSMACWAVLLSLLAANGLRLVQVETFISRQLNQVPPLARAADPARPDAVFVDLRSGFYTQDMVQNDPFLRAPRIIFVYHGAAAAAALVAQRFPGYTRQASGPWGEHWAAPDR